MLTKLGGGGDRIDPKNYTNGNISFNRTAYKTKTFFKTSKIIKKLRLQMESRIRLSKTSELKGKIEILQETTKNCFFFYFVSVF